MVPGVLLYLPPMHKWKPAHKLIVFTIGLLLINGVLAFAAFRYLPYDKNRRYKLDKEFAQIKDTLNYLFIGNSHVNRGLEPDSLPKAWAFHGPTETAPYFYYRLKSIVEDQPQAARYYIMPGELGVAAFNQQPLIYMGDYWKRYFDFWELAQVSETPFYYIGLEAKLRTVPYFQFPASLMFLRDLQAERRQYKKYLKDTWADYSATMKDTILNYMLDRHELIDAVSTEVGLAYLEKIKTLAAAHDLRIVFVKWPLHPLYRQGTVEQGLVAPEIERAVDSLLLSSPHIRLLNFERLYDDNDTLYMDPHHLSKVGKARFSVMLRDTLSAIYEADFGVKP